jgi:hypothetical protein
MTINLIPDATGLAMLQAVGGICVSAPRSTFTGLFEADFTQVGELPVDSSAPRLTARTSDVRAGAIAIGTALIIEGDTYIVRSVQDDRTGMTVLLLEGP